MKRDTPKIEKLEFSSERDVLPAFVVVLEAANLRRLCGADVYREAVRQSRGESRLISHLRFLRECESIFLLMYYVYVASAIANTGELTW
jgi:hypothetical protein